MYQKIVEALDQGQPFALGILTRTRGSSPQKPGAKALFFPDGRIEGTLGGGCLEAEVRERARSALRSGMPAQFELLLDHDFGWDDGLICGGKVSGLILPAPRHGEAIFRAAARREAPVSWGVLPDFTLARIEAGVSEERLYEETVYPRIPLWIAGAGHIARAVAPLALSVDFQVRVLDDRPAMASRRWFPSGVELQAGGWEDLLVEPPPPNTFGLIVTRGHQHDAVALRHWVPQPFDFLGMIGSRRKRRMLFEELERRGLASSAQLARVECPVGLPIEAVSPEEIAVSILARLVQCRAGLRSRPGTGIQHPGA